MRIRDSLLFRWRLRRMLPGWGLVSAFRREVARAVIRVAEAHVGRDLTLDEAACALHDFVMWIVRNDARQDELVSQPERTIQRWVTLEFRVRARLPTPADVIAEWLDGD